MSGYRWISAAVLGALVAVTAMSGAAWGARLASSEWPMFHRDEVHTGRAAQEGPPRAETRWWQGGAAISPYEDNHVPHGPQGAIWSSAASSEVSEEVPGAPKVWYFHRNSWTGRGAVPPNPGEPLMLRSECPDDDAYGVPIMEPPTTVFFETSAAMQFSGASGETLNTLVYANRDPYNNLTWVEQADGTFRYQMRIPAGLWTFDFWVTNVPTATNINFTIYRFPHVNPDNRAALPGLDPVSIPIPQTPNGPLRRIRFVHRVADDILLEPDDGIAIGVTTDTGGSASLVVEGRAWSRVVTPIEVPAVYAGSDDGSLWAFDAATGNVLWSYSVSGAWFRSSPAVGDDGTIYIGSYEGPGHDQGRLYAFNRDGTLKWTYPALQQTAYFRSGYLAPDDPALFPPDTAPLYPFPGNGTDVNPPTAAQTGTDASGRYVQFIPRTTNAVSLAAPPGDLTQAGWLFEINPEAQERTLHEGVWTFDLALRALDANTQDAYGFIAYRISKVEVVPGAPPTLALLEEIQGWTQHSERLQLPADGRTIWAHLETPTIQEVQFAQGEHIFVELLVRQVVSTGAAGGGWELLLEGVATRGGPHSQLLTPGLSQTRLKAISASPVISPDDVVYIATHGGYVHAVEAVDGSRRWATALRQNNLADEIRSSPAYSPSGKVYVGSMNGRLYALDGNDGDILWRYPLAGPALGAIESSPALDVDREHIYFGSNDGSVYCVQEVLSAPNVIEPQLQWSFATGAPVVATPALGPDGTVYVGSRDHFMYALRPDDGTLVPGWPYQAVGEIQSSAAVAASLSVFFVNEPENPPAALPLHLSQSVRGDYDGDEPRREISVRVTESAPSRDFTQEFRTHQIADEFGRPTDLPAGTYVMDLWGRAQIPPTAQATLTLRLFRVSAGGVETQLLTFVQPVEASATLINYRAEAFLASPITLDSDERLLVRITGSAAGLAEGQYADIYFGFDGATPSHLEGPTLIYFATSVFRQGPPSPIVLPRGRVYCLDQNGKVVWIDPFDFQPGYDPRGADPLSQPTAFTASPSLWKVEDTWVITEQGGQVTAVARRRSPVLYLGGHDGVMYAFGPVPEEMAPPPPRPPIEPPSVLTLTKEADKEVVSVENQDGQITPDEIVTFTLRYRNDGSPLALPAEGVTIDDWLPVDPITGNLQVELLDASDGGIRIGDVVHWDASTTPALAAIWPQDTGQVQFRVYVLPDVVVIPPLGEEDPQEYPQPFVYVSHTDPVTQGVTQPLHPWDPEKFQWGDVLYIFLAGRGKPTPITNSPEDNPATISAATGEQAFAAPVTVYAGWGKRYRLTFVYDPANDPDPMTPPDNQPIIFTTEIPLTGADTRSGGREEAYEYEDPVAYPDPRLQYAGEALGLTVFKVQLSPQGYRASPGGVSITELPNRPWCPYYWRVIVQQNRGGTPGREDWGPEWQALDEATGLPYSDFDFIIHNPLEVIPATYALAGGGTINHDTQTQSTAFTIVNISKHSLTGVGATRPGGVIRWEKVDLAQAGAPYDPGAPYQFRDENYLPENRIHLSRSHVALAGGQREEDVGVWGDVPRYLSPGTYQAPRAQSLPTDPVTSDMAIYVDLNGNQTWDPGEAKFENEIDFDALGQFVTPPDDPGDPWDGPFGPFVMRATVSLQPWVRFGSETVDAAKVPPGATAGVPAPALLNLGNVDLSAITLDPLDASGLLPLQRSDLGQVELRDRRETRPLYWDLSAVSGTLAKTPVGEARPYQQWLLLDEPGDPADDLVIAHDQPSGTYSRAPDAVSTVAGVTTRDASPFKARVVERRLTGYDAAGDPVLGADVHPWATFVDNNTLRVIWSSQRKPDGSDPTPANPPIEAEPYNDLNGNRQWDVGEPYDDRNGNGQYDRGDPYFLRHATLDRENDTWSAPGTYPDPTSDPMDTLPPAPYAHPWLAKQHLTPGHGVDAEGGEWLFWGGSALRPSDTGGHGYDNRLLAVGVESGLWPPDAGDPIEQEPDVSGGAGASGLFRLQPQPLFWDDGANEWNYVVLSQQSTTQPWRLAVRYRSRTLPGGAWSAWAEQSLPTSSGLTAARDPSAFLFDGYLWVVFSGVSSYHGNYDIYCARYDVTTLTQVPFARVSEALAPDAANTVFASRHKEWALSDPPAAGDVNIYVGATLISGVPVDLGNGRYRINDGTYNPEFDPALGTVYFASDPGAQVSADYTPRLLRLTTHPADESNPSAFVETYRYVDDQGTPDPGDDTYEPADYDPRLWVFWTQAGMRSLGAEIMYLTLRESANYYFHGEGSGEPTGAGLLHPRGPEAAAADAPVGPGLAFDTQAGAPDVIEIPDGPWVFDFWAYGEYADYATENAQVYFRVYRRTAGGSNVLLFETAATPKLTPLPRRYTIAARPGALTLEDGDRLYVEVLAVVSGSAQAHFLYESGYGSRFSAPLMWNAERPPRAVPVEHVANEFGLCAVKDPLYAQVWLFWSSTRAAPTTQGDAAADSDIYYQCFSPDLP